MQQSDRLRLILKIKKIKQTEMAVFGNVTPATISRYLSGRQLDIDFVISLYNKLNVNPTWLLTGEGEMFLGRSGNSNIGNNYGNGSIGNITINSNNSHTQTVVLTDEELELVKSYREKQFKQIMKKIANMLCFWR